MENETILCDSMDALSGKYLTFSLGDEVYGLEILKVQEILGLLQVTKIPKAPVYVRGVVNLRGRVIPVVDLRNKFNLCATADTNKTCIIVVQIAHYEKHLTMGLIVDEVAEVVDVSAEAIEPAPEFGAGIDIDFILGLGKVGDRVVMLLDADKILSVEERSVVSEN